ncbi:WXG100-like domain-containing protein [Kineosporia babensis]|uniref:Tox-PL domain-containing protein n=1 Tax=Kineosporia babensis TaxID=499548 RepID=A0A9X1NDP8_9ACTN|nr:hypothetical protein [Kineosporia babensis]
MNDIRDQDLRRFLEAVTGIPYPAVDEVKLRAVAEVLSRSAVNVGEIADLLVPVVHAVQGDLNGQTGRAFRQRVAPFVLQEPGLLQRTADHLSESGRHAEAVALEIDYLKRLMRYMMVFLAIQIAIAYVEVLYNPPGAAARILAAQTIARTAVTRAAAAVMARVTAQVMVLEVGPVLLAQLEQIAVGLRTKGLDQKKVVDAVAEGFLGLGLGLTAAKVLDSGLSALGRNLGPDLGKTGSFANALRDLPLAVGTDVVAELLTTGILYGTWSVGWSAVTSAAIESAGVAGAAGIGTLALLNKQSGLNDLPRTPKQDRERGVSAERAGSPSAVPPRERTEPAPLTSPATLAFGPGVRAAEQTHRNDLSVEAPRSAAGEETPALGAWATEQAADSSLAEHLAELLARRRQYLEDCLDLLRRLHERLYSGSGPAFAATADQALTPEAQLAQELGARRWQPVGNTWGAVTEAVQRSGPGSTAFVYSRLPERPQHAFAVTNWGGQVLWVDPQAPRGEQIRAVDQAPQMPVEARAIVLDSAGRVVELPETGRLGRLADALTLPSTSHHPLGREALPGNRILAEAERVLDLPAARGIRWFEAQREAFQHLRDLGADSPQGAVRLAEQVGARRSDLLNDAVLARHFYPEGYTVGELRGMERLRAMVADDPTLRSAVVSVDGQLSPAHLRELARVTVPAFSTDQAGLDALVRDLANAGTRAERLYLQQDWSDWHDRLAQQRIYDLEQLKVRIGDTGRSLALLPLPEQQQHRQSLNESFSSAKELTILQRPSCQERDTFERIVRTVEDELTAIHGAAVTQASDLPHRIGALSQQYADRYGPPGATHGPVAPGPLTAADVVTARAALNDIETGLNRLAVLSPDAGVADRAAVLQEQLAKLEKDYQTHHAAAGGDTAKPQPEASAAGRRLPGRVLVETEAGRPVPWGELGHVVRVGDVPVQALDRVADRAVIAFGDRIDETVRTAIRQEISNLALINQAPPPEHVPAVEQTDHGYEDQQSGWEAGRRLSAPEGLDLGHGVRLHLDLGPLHEDGAVTYRKPEDMQNLRIGQKPTKTSDPTHIHIPGTYAATYDGRSANLNAGLDVNLPGAATLSVGGRLTARGQKLQARWEGGLYTTEHFVETAQFAYFSTRADRGPTGSRWRLTRAGAEDLTAAENVLLAFPDNESPESKEIRTNQGRLFRLPEAASPMQREALMDVLWRVVPIDESISLDAADDPARQLAGRFTGIGEQTRRALDDLFTDSSLLRHRMDIFGSGYLTPAMETDDHGGWAAFRLKGQALSVQLVDTGKGSMRQDARHLFWGSETKNYQGTQGGAGRGSVRFPKIGLPEGSSSFGLGGSSGPLGARTREEGASSGAGDWRVRNIEGKWRTYRIEAELETDVRSDDHTAREPIASRLIRYLRVGENEADRFEKEVEAVVNSTDDLTVRPGSRLPVDADSARDRQPPPSVLAGKSRGPGVVDVLGTYYRIAGEATELLQEGLNRSGLLGAQGLSAWDAHDLERWIMQNFSVRTALPFTSQLISHHHSRTTYLDAPGGRLKLAVQVRSDQGTTWEGAKLAKGAIDHTHIGYSDFANIERLLADVSSTWSGNFGGSSGGVTDARGTLGVGWRNRHQVEAMIRNGTSITHGYQYSGAFRSFTFPASFRIDTSIVFEPHVATGGVVSAALVKSATGAVPKAFSWSGSRNIAGIIRYNVPEGLSPTADPGNPAPASPVLGSVQTIVPPGPGPLPPMDLAALTNGPVLETPRLRRNDLALEVLGVPEIAATTARLLEAAGIPESDYRNPLETWINEDEFLGRLMINREIVSFNHYFAAGATANRHARVTLVGRPFTEHVEAGHGTFQQTVVVQAEPATFSRYRVRPTEMATTGLDPVRTGNGAFTATSTRTVRDTEISKIQLNEPIGARRLYFEKREHTLVRSGMVWDIQVDSADANLALNSADTRHGGARLVVLGGLLVLRPEADLPQPQPTGIPQTLSPQSFPLFTLPITLDVPQEAPGTINDVLAAVRAVLVGIDPKLLDGEWVAGKDGRVPVGLNAGLSTLLDEGAVLGERYPMEGPGLLLHQSRSVPGGIEDVTLTLRSQEIPPEEIRPEWVEAGLIAPDGSYLYDGSQTGDQYIGKVNTQKGVTLKNWFTMRMNTATGTVSAFPVLPGTSGGNVSGSVMSNPYISEVRSRAKMLRTRDLLKFSGQVHGYRGMYQITVSAERYFRPSKPVRAVGLGLAGRALNWVAQERSPAVVRVYVPETVHVLDRVLRAPGPVPGRSAVVLEGIGDLSEILRENGLRELPVSRAEIFDRNVVVSNLSPRALRELYDSTLHLLGTQAPGIVRTLMAVTGGPREAYSAMVGHTQTVTSFHLTTGDGHTYPPLVLEDGSLSDPRGSLHLTHRFYDAETVDWITSAMLTETNGMREQANLKIFGDSLSGTIGGVVNKPLATPSVLFTFGAGAGGDHGKDVIQTVNERLPYPSPHRRLAPFMRVQAGLLVAQEFGAHRERRSSSHGQGDWNVVHRLDQAVEILVDSETVVTNRLLHRELGSPTAHGRWLPDLPVEAPEPGSDRFRAELTLLQAAFALPRYGEWYPVAGTYRPASAGGPGHVLLTSNREREVIREELTVKEFARRLDLFPDRWTAAGDPAPRPVLLVMGGVDHEFGSRLAELTGTDVMATPHAWRQDGHLRAVRRGPVVDVDGEIVLYPRDGSVALTYEGDLGKVLTEQVPWHLLGKRVKDPVGLITPRQPVYWEATSSAVRLPDNIEDLLTAEAEAWQTETVLRPSAVRPLPAALVRDLLKREARAWREEVDRRNAGE